MAVFRVHRTSMKGAYVFIFLISLRTLAWASSSNNHDSTCIDGCTGFCKSATDVNLHKKAVWICRGRFGRLDLNCSGNQTIKTSQMISCQAAIIYRPTEAEDEEVSSMFMHKVNCTAGRTDCRNEVLANRLGLWQCHWDKLCLLIDYRGYIQLRSVQERQGSLHYFNGSIQGSRNKTTKVLPHELFPNWPQDTNCSGQTDPVPSTAVTPTNASLATGKGSSRFNSSKITPNWPQDTNCSGQTVPCVDVTIQELKQENFTANDPVLSTAVTPTNASLATGKGSSRFNSSKITPNWPQDTTCSGQTVPCVDVTIQELKQENFTANDPVLSTAVTPTNASLATGKGSSRANSSKIIDDVRNYLSQFKCNASSIQTLLLQLEGTLRRWLAEILNSSSNQTSLCIRDEIIDITVKVLADSNETITVPGPSEVASFSLPPNSIATKNGSIGILTAAFKFDRQCNDSQGLTLQEGNSNGPSTLRSPIITVLAASPQGDIKDLRANATLTFRTKNAGPSSPQCVFLNSTSRSWSSDGMYLKENLSTNYTTCLSEHLTSFAVLINYKDKTRPLDPGEKLALNIITKIGCGIGIFCLIACILIFTCIRGLSATRFRIHLNLCIALTAALVLFISGIEATQIKGVCIAVAIMLHYFFTASFSWMCIEAVHLFTKIVSVFNVQVRRLRYYVAVGWGLPAVIVAISVSANFNGYSTPDKCWLTLEGSLIWAFLAPVIIIVLINVAVLIAVIFVRLTLKGNILTPNEDKKFVAALKTVVVLFPLLGLSWLFGLMAILTQNRAFLYPFAILSPFQGVFIFLFQIIGNREVRASVRSARERHSTNSSLRLEQKKREKKANKVPGNKNTEAVCLMMRLTATKERNKNKMEPTHV
ncbi:adhesion G protein-coupled receptor L2-like isoform X6 [Acropora millepora]|uniref:adhesion G protein-coupled receptor L2-like isoform X6 n=1 Tax=Acropora millepora TaxID=45264 RepID=UPI001CF4EA19|nr:adhesion G protein-coupled receptor L2-like isoform X6 [Acropora millepora]